MKNKLLPLLLVGAFVLTGCTIKLEGHGSSDPVDPAHEEEEEEIYPEHDHYWEAPIWSWSEDNQTARAKFECSVYNHYHIETATVEDDQIEIENIKEADHYEDGLDKYVATVTFSGATYTSPDHFVVINQGQHEFNEYGICLADGEFLYEETNELDYDFKWMQMYGEYKAEVNVDSEDYVAVGDKIIFKFHLDHKGHEIKLRDLVNITVDDITIGYVWYEDFYEVKYTEYYEYTFEDFPSNNVFAIVDKNSEQTNRSFSIVECHTCNKIGVCEDCYRYLGSYFGTTQPITFSFTAGKVINFRFQAWPGRKYFVFFQRDLEGHEDEFEIYSVDQYFNPVPYDLNDPFPEDPFPEDGWGHILYVYMIFTPTTSGTGYLAVDLIPE